MNRIYEPISGRQQAANVAVTLLSAVLLTATALAGLPALLFGDDLQLLGAILLGGFGQTVTTALMALYVATRSPIRDWLYLVTGCFHLIALSAAVAA